MLAGTGGGKVSSEINVFHEAAPKTTTRGTPDRLDAALLSTRSSVAISW
jgi:hypothetical protein